ncbi:dynamin family protein [Gallibacterium anatis]|uniref:dynamin family protein n=2 Tax=Gallibacterium anatis TaxID=750 RepID=UPI00068CC9EF|nr:dynamin family protein [Gallibacterium anatis]
MSNNIFEVIIVGTMSAGKSTVINALIGQELLHSANQATTATITSIHDKDGKTHFSGTAYDYEGEILEKARIINAETLKNWNADDEIKTIEIIGDIKTITNSEAELVIYDLPGPNNSQDDNHEQLTMEVIDDGHYGLILYVLNATQLGINDDRHLLETIHQSLANDKNKEILFILNKADQLDQEKERSLQDTIDIVKNYLTDIGFSTPTIIPVSAKNALFFQKVLNNDQFSRREKFEFQQLIENRNNVISENIIFDTSERKRFEQYLQRNNCLYEDIEISDGFDLSKEELIQFYHHTGFGAVCYLLQKRVDSIFIKETIENQVSSLDNHSINSFNPISNELEIYVIGTMSSGKSTFINSLVGSELLPAANEATISVITKIIDNKDLPKGKFKGKRITKEGVIANSSEEVTSELLRDWNNTAIYNDTACIELEGDILGIAKRDNVRWVLIDTPSYWEGNSDYQNFITNKIQDANQNSLICYLLNATQIGINDDKYTLITIAETLNKGKSKQNNDRFLFLLNKADCFDEERGESVEKMLNQCKNYLESNGITNPKIFPMSALSAYLFRKRQFNFDLTRNEKRLLDNWEFKAIDDEYDDYEGLDFVKYMPLTSTVKEKLARQDINEILLHTGIPAIEAVIDDYIDKYSISEPVIQTSEINNDEFKAVSIIFEKLTQWAEADLDKIGEEYDKEVSVADYFIMTFVSMIEELNSNKLINRDYLPYGVTPLVSIYYFFNEYSGEDETYSIDNLLDYLKTLATYLANPNDDSLATSLLSANESSISLFRTTLRLSKKTNENFKLPTPEQYFIWRQENFELNQKYLEKIVALFQEINDDDLF